MRKMFLVITSLLSISFFATFHAQENKQFPLREINSGLEKSSHIKIVVFTPSVTEKTEYASMIIQAFRNYFIEKLAFAPKDREKANVDVILVSQRNGEIKQLEVNKKKKEQILFDERSTQEIYSNLFNTEGIQVFYGINESLRSQLNLPSFEDSQSDSVLFLLDETNTIVWRDDHYRGQGEHLKPLEYKVKDLFGLPYPQVKPSEVFLKVGDKAPDILVNGKKLSEYWREVKVLAFYPAAYSGKFDTAVIAKRISVHQATMMSCAMHIVSFDGLSSKIGGMGGAVYFAVSESTPEILENWKRALGTYHIQYVNDPDYSISQAFGAYNLEGYNNRITVIIDKDGKIAYMDSDYKLGKEAEIQEVITKLQSKS